MQNAFFDFISKSSNKKKLKTRRGGTHFQFRYSEGKCRKTSVSSRPVRDVHELRHTVKLSLKSTHKICNKLKTLPGLLNEFKLSLSKILSPKSRSEGRGCLAWEIPKLQYPVQETGCKNSTCIQVWYQKPGLLTWEVKENGQEFKVSLNFRKLGNKCQINKPSSNNKKNSAP